MIDHTARHNHGGLLPGSDNDALLQALRNVWPILSPTGRQQAINTADTLKGHK